MNTSETPRDAARRLSAGALANGFQPEALHTYRDAAGSPLYWRIRAKHESGEKYIRPMKLNGHGYEFGEPAFPNGKPIYNLDRIARDATSTVWIVEGEKAADALTKAGLLAVTTGGADSADAADWTPLCGRTCRLWPDNDEAGARYMVNVGGHLQGLGCAVATVDVDALNLPPKADCVDWLAAHADASPGDIDMLPLHSPSSSVQHSREATDESENWPAGIDAAAMHGIAGEFVRLVEPQTESDPAAILLQFLAAFGALVGRGPHYLVEGDQHHANLYILLVGASAKGRKGTSWSRVRALFERVGDRWKRPVSGMSSGEGIKYHVRDAREETKTDKEGYTVTEVVDQGVPDKRLFVVEPEFAGALRVAGRPGNTLTATIREGWDSGNLNTLTKNDPVTATGAHICIVGHVTDDELRAELTATDTANGFANRFLFVAVRRSKFLPFGGDTMDEGEQETLAGRLRNLAELAGSRGRVTMTEGARAVWERVYPILSAGRDGLHGAVTARGEAQTIRLALIYCLLDGAEQIDTSHLLAALAIWEYCSATARHVFGASLGDRVADDLLRRLEHAGAEGMNRTEIRDAFSRHQSGRITAALNMLKAKGSATLESVAAGPTGGRPREVWRAVK